MQKHYRIATATFLSVVAIGGVVGCSGHPGATAHTTSSAKAPIDPLVRITDKSDDFYSDAQPVVHELGRGTKTFDIGGLPAGTKRITFYVSCAPDSHYEVTMGKTFAGPCERIVGNSGGIPLDGGGDAHVTVKLPAQTQFWLVGIPDED